ncbi:MAG: ABC transporter substrate-binding protein [Candidatus Rokubacteria bacterium]|nr:ABC transporter substrate-binding protein [Candidatus Rokubacteria bacterium]MBI3826519.1 ABC transporter substrate-binding protein [Candidatus Rokubacteria bacterium]
MGNAALALLMLAAVSVGSGTPREVVQASVGRVLTAAQEARVTSTEGAPARGEARAELRRVSTDLFDFNEMSRRALPRQWPRLGAGERKEFVDLFTDLLARAYLGRIEGYAGERIAYLGETIDGSFAAVRSRITSRRNTETGLEYRLHLVDGRWRVYDVVVDGVSLVATYRDQFTRVMQAASWGGLLDALRRRQLESRPLDQHAERR